LQSFEWVSPFADCSESERTAGKEIFVVDSKIIQDKLTKFHSLLLYANRVSLKPKPPLLRGSAEVLERKLPRSH
jgi:hypothetical protein